MMSFGIIIGIPNSITICSLLLSDVAIGAGKNHCCQARLRDT